jgi:hypothetical protein
MEGETDGWGQPVSGRKKKKKEGGEADYCVRGSWAGGPKGREVRSFSFFLFLFKSFFKFKLFQNVFKSLQTHLKLLKLQTFTQNTMQLKYDAQALVVSKLTKLN